MWGRGLSGTSLMNAMVYMRGNRGDYDHWRDLASLRQLQDGGRCDGGNTNALCRMIGEKAEALILAG